MDSVQKKQAASSRTRSIVFVGLTISLMAVSAWVSIPLGPVPFTLQTFVMVFAFLVLSPRECIAAITGYLVLGAVGLPLFSSMRGGVGVLAGPTGGFLWGFLLGAIVALMFRWAIASLMSKRAEKGAKTTSKFSALAIDLTSGVLFLGVTYACGWVQLMQVAALSPMAAFLTAIAPFILIDAVKLAAAVLCARAVQKALPRK